MSYLTADEIKERYTKNMGKSLGQQYNALWQEVAWLHTKWREFVELFGSKPSRIDLLNQAAPAFFRLIQDSLWENILLHIARLTDPPKSLGVKANLTICNLADLVSFPQTSAAVRLLISVAQDKSRFCRDWRNRHIAHKDLNLALNASAAPLQAASRQCIREALSAIVAVLNEIEGAYMDSETHFEGPSRAGGAVIATRNRRWSSNRSQACGAAEAG
jgi:hypothetical protein